MLLHSFRVHMCPVSIPVQRHAHWNLVRPPRTVHDHGVSYRSSSCQRTHRQCVEIWLRQRLLLRDARDLCCWTGTIPFGGKEVQTAGEGRAH